MNWQLENGNPIKVVQTTRYPWEGNVMIQVAPAHPEEFSFYVRIPGWSRNTTVKVNGKPTDAPASGEYFKLRRVWTAGNVVEVVFKMETQLVHANPAVADDTGRIVI
jgi:uncharacterized protein